MTNRLAFHWMNKSEIIVIDFGTASSITPEPLEFMSEHQ